jgi:HPt (histidine-containing phosphotransfer) domain-containing protein
MAYDAGSFDATLAAAAGDDPELLAQLRAGFLESMAHQVDLLRRARCDGNWQVAAMRLKGLGASFHAPQLVKLADEALDSAPGEPTVLRKLDRLCQEIATRGHA